ncbi:MAG: hypothetical protein KF729_27600 [Sandaracinaceae bacterium]|nr:hypothetical protein [Sandaracinaceae bacterium]
MQWIWFTLLPLALAAASKGAPSKQAAPAPTWASTVGRVAPLLPAPEGVDSLETSAGGSPVGFTVAGALDETWSRWRAALEGRGVRVTVLEEDATSVTAHLDAADGARGYVSLGAGSARVHGSLGWVARPAPPALPGRCVEPPRVDVRVLVHGREANPRPEHRDGAEVAWRFTTTRALDLDADGRLDVVVPRVSARACPHEVAYDLYVMRGACGHLVGRTLGFPTVTGPPGAGLRELTSQRRWAEITDPTRPPGPENVATLHEVATPYVARAGRYRAGTPVARSGICHHCAISRCRVVERR